MSIKSYISTSSPGRNRLPVPKKCFRGVYSQDRNIIVPTKTTSLEDQHDGVKSHATVLSELKHTTGNSATNSASCNASNNVNNNASNIVSNNVSNIPGINRVVKNADNSGVKSAELNASRDNSRNNSCGSLVESEDGGKESRKEAREAFLKSDHLSKKYDAPRDLSEPPQPPTHAEKEVSLANKYNNHSTNNGHPTNNYTNTSNNVTSNNITSNNNLTNHPTTNHPSSNGVLKGAKTGRDQDSYIGFANLPNQVYRKSVKKGFDFTLMLIGESGLGKSTMINSMFLTDLYNTQHPGPSRRPSKTVKVEKNQVLLKEGGVQLRLTIVDTPGFGDSVNNSECWKPILTYIDDQYDSFLNMESRVVRQEAEDTRVHCCLYFISPNGHGLRQLDIECMKQLHEKVNIIPLIAKADSMTLDECRDFKKTIINEIEHHKIKIYEFPDCEDEEEQKMVKRMKDKIPFAVVGSNAVLESNGRNIRARVYPWGTVEVENLEHNDFTALRNMLIRTHLHDLKDVTNNVHYENFRFDRLITSIGADNSTQSNKSPLLQIEEEKKEHCGKLKRMEVEMGQMFEAKVNERRTKLHESDMELQRRKEQLLKSLEQQQVEYEEMKRGFLSEREAWEEQNRNLEIELTSTLKKKKTLFN